MVEIVKFNELTGLRNQIRIYHPPMALAPYIRYYWIMDISEPNATMKGFEAFACRYPVLVFQHLHQANPILRNGSPLPPSWVFGMGTRHREYTMYGNYAHTAVTFQPGGIKRFFGVDAHELNNEFADLSELPMGTLNNRLHASWEDGVKIRMLNHFFTERLKEFSKHRFVLSPQIINGSFEMSDYGVYQLSKKLKLSERQLQRKFRAHIGIPPCTFQRIVRFEAALERLKESKTVNFSQMAYDLGFADQSHFIRDFREFSNLTPLQFHTRNLMGNTGGNAMNRGDIEISIKKNLPVYV